MDTLLTTEDVLRWKNELKIAQGRVAELQAKLDAAAMFLSPEAKRQIEAAAEAAQAIAGGEDPGNMRAAVRRLVGQAQNGISYKALIAELQKDPDFAARINRNPQTVYTSINRLRNRVPPEIFKEGKLLFTAENRERYLVRRDAASNVATLFRPGGTGR